MTTKFSQFPAGGTIGVGAKIAGLDASVSPDNRIFDFPGLGILDTNGSVLLGWSQPLSGTAVNYLEFQNALSGNPAVISAIGGDTDVGLYLTSQNDGNISLVPGGFGVTIIAGTTALGLPGGGTGQRPVGAAGYTRYNSDTGTLEYYDGLSNTWNTLSAGGTVASVSGTTGRITSTGGVNPIIDIDFSYVGQTSIQNLGTITTGTWQADVVQPIYGGTGLAAVTAYSVVCGGITDTGPLQVVSGLGSVGEVLTSNGAGALPTWQPAGAGSVISVSGTANRVTSTGGANPVIDIDAAYAGQASINTVGTISSGMWNASAITVPYGGTGDASFTAYSLICGGTTSTGSLQNVVGLGMLGQVLTSNGAGALPTWTSVAGGTVSSVSGTAGQIVVVNGATTPTVSIDPTYIGQTSLTTLGTITTGTWHGSIIDSSFGGTGVNNGSNTLTLGGNLTTAGAFASTFTMTGATSVTFPTSGTLATTAGTVSSVSGTANRITSTGGTSPTIDIAATYVGQASITTLGTVTTGTWNGSLVDVSHGGTGNNIFTAYGVVCGGTTGTGPLQSISSVGTSGQVLTSQGAGALPIWATPASGSVTSVTGTANRITATGGTTPVIDISAAYVGQTSIITLGTVTTGVWNASVIGAAYGGTGINNGVNTITLGGDISTAGSFTTLGAFPAIFTFTGATNVTFPTSGTLSTTTGTVTNVTGTANRITVATGTTTPAIDIAATYVGQTSITTLGTITAGTWNGTTVDVAHGGTGDTSFTAYSLICGGTTGTGNLQSVVSVGTSGQVLTSNGAGALPTWATPTAGTVTSVTGGTGINVINTTTTPVVSISSIVAVNNATNNFGFNEQYQMTLQDYVETVSVLGSITGAASLDLTTGNVFTATATGNTTLSFTNVPATGCASISLLATNFGAFTITWPGSVTWVAGSAPTLASAGTSTVVFYTVNGGSLWYGVQVGASSVSSVAGDGSTISVASGTSNAIVSILNTYAGQTSITTLGTIATGTWHGSVVGPTYGGTGVNNGSNTLTLAGNLATSGAFASTFTMTGATNVTFPTSGTLSTTTGTVTSIVAGTGLSGGTITTSGTIAMATNNKCCGRLTLTSNVPVTTSDVLAATTVYFTPFNGNFIDLYTSGAWKTYTFSQLSFSVPAVASTMHDVFLYDNSGTLTFNIVAWTNDTTRATALAFQNGTYVLSGSPQYRYLGSFRTTSVSGQTEDSVANRFLWNYYNRTQRTMSVVASTTWTYAVNTIRQANASSTNQLNFILGVSDQIIDTSLTSVASAATNNRIGVVYIGLNSTTAQATGSLFNATPLAASGQNYGVAAAFRGYANPGYNYLAWLESSPSAVAITYGTVANLNQGAIIGYLMA